MAVASPAPDHRLTAFRLVGPKSPEEKNALLVRAIDSLRGGDVAEGREIAAAK